MRRFLRTGIIIALLTTVAACDTPVVPDEAVDLPDPPLSVSSAASSRPAIHNPPDDVTMTGRVEEAGMTIAMEGTHRLVLASDERVVLLQSDTINLDDYEGETVRLTGSARPAVEGGGTIVTVHDIEIVWSEGAGSSEAVDDTMVSSASSDSSSAASPTIASSSAPSRAASSSAASRRTVSSRAASSPPSAAASFSSSQQTAMVDLMATETVDAAHFTQQYCSGHVGFCIPVHRDWYYYSFGATSSYLWHVEVNAQEIENLGDGPLVVNFVAGDLPPSISDGSVVVDGGRAVGYRAWTGGRHFEISASAVLQEAVTFMTANLSVYQVNGGSSSSVSVSSGTSASAANVSSK